MAGRVLKSMQPGQPGTKRLVKRFGKKLIRVRYRGDEARRVRSTTVEIVVEQGFWDPVGYKNHKKAAVSSGRHSR